MARAGTTSSSAETAPMTCGAVRATINCGAARVGTTSPTDPGPIASPGARDATTTSVGKATTTGTAVPTETPSPTSAAGTTSTGATATTCASRPTTVADTTRSWAARVRTTGTRTRWTP